MRKLMTKANMNDYLVGYIGLDPEEVAIMPQYVKVDIIEDDFDTFVQYLEEEDD